MLPPRSSSAFASARAMASSWPITIPTTLAGSTSTRSDAKEMLETGVKRLAKLQERL